MRETWRGMYSTYGHDRCLRSRGPAGVERGQGSYAIQPTKRRVVIAVIVVVLHYRLPFFT
jgi:hypothetical protein